MENTKHVDMAYVEENNSDVLVVYDAPNTAQDTLLDTLDETFSNLSDEELKYSLVWLARMLEIRQEEPETVDELYLHSCADFDLDTIIIEGVDYSRS